MSFLYYQEKGEGFPLILLHGNGENGDYFKSQMEFFSKKYRVIAVDTRGHGRSPRGTGDFTIKRFAEDLKDFMDELNIEKAHILGFSDGANIGMTFAMKYGNRVSKLILNGGNLNPLGVKLSVQLPIELSYRMARFCAANMPGAKPKAEMLSLMVNEPNFKPSDLKRLHMPVLVIAGTKDMIKESHTKEIAEALPKGKLVFIKGDHFIAAKNSEEFNRAVEEFLA